MSTNNILMLVIVGFVLYNLCKQSKTMETFRCESDHKKHRELVHTSGAKGAPLHADDSLWHSVPTSLEQEKNKCGYNHANNFKSDEDKFQGFDLMFNPNLVVTTDSDDEECHCNKKRKAKKNTKKGKKNYC